MDKIKSFKGMNSDERLASLEQVVSRSKKLMLLLPDGCLLLSNDEQEKLWAAFKPYLIFDPERDNIPTLYHIYYLDNAEAEAFLKPYNSAPDCYSIINGHNVAVQLISGGKPPHFEVITDDDTPRTVWSIQGGLAKDGLLVIGFDEMSLSLSSDLLAVSDISLSDMEDPDEISSSIKPQTRTRSDPIKTLIMRYLDKTNGSGDFRGCIEFLLIDPEVQEGSEGEILWNSYGGKPQTAKRKTIQNRFNKCKNEWKPLNQ